MLSNLNRDRRLVLDIMIENSNLIPVGSKEKHIFLANRDGNGRVAEIFVDVQHMNARQLLDAALDFSK